MKRLLFICIMLSCSMGHGSVDGGSIEISEDMFWPRLKNASTISGGTFHTCALYEGKVHCVEGRSYENSLIKKFRNPNWMSSGGNIVCVLDGARVNCWDPKTGTAIDVPENIGTPKNVVINYNHLCALYDNSIKCWGENTNGQLNVPDTISPKALAVGLDHSCVLDKNGITCWGNNDLGQLDVPKNLKNPKSIVAGNEFTCALDNLGVQCWGGNQFDRVPVKNPRAIAAFHTNICVLDDSELGVACWQINSEVEPCGPYESCRPLPHRMPIGLKKPRSISVNAFGACALDIDGMKCWNF